LYDSGKSRRTGLWEWHSAVRRLSSGLRPASFVESRRNEDCAWYETKRISQNRVEENSGSITHDIGGATVEKGTMKIDVVSAMPEVGTDDKLARFIVLECSKEVMKNVKSFTAYYQWTDATPTPLADLPADYGTYEKREQAGVYVVDVEPS
jgi:hypothetical protein